MSDETTHVTPASRPFRVLSLDGGGMRGLYSASVLHTLKTQFAQQRGLGDLDVGKGFDLIVGTSTGGLLACGLAQGVPTNRLLSLYREDGPKIFTNPKPVASKPLSFLNWCRKVMRVPANENQSLKAALTNLFGKMTLAEMYTKRKIALCIPSVTILTEEARVFKTPHNLAKRRDNAYTLVDVCLATSAAPIYLPMAAIDSPVDPGRHDVFVDGGLWANNPILVGIIEALSLTPPERPIQIISIGTCHAPEGEAVSKDGVQRGLWAWSAGTKVLTLSMNAQDSGSNFMASLLEQELNKLGKKLQLVRLPELKPSFKQMKHLQLDLASPDALQSMSSLGEHDGVQSFRLCQDPGNIQGRMITDIFNDMPPMQSNL